MTREVEPTDSKAVAHTAVGRLFLSSPHDGHIAFTKRGMCGHDDLRDERREEVRLGPY